MYKKVLTLTLSIIVLSVVSCKPPYTMETPQSFKKYEKSRDFKMITADGVMLKARQTDNYPKGSLQFWTDAMEKHLIERGYLKKTKECFKTKNRQDGCTVTFVLPYGTEDWTFSQTIFVVNDVIVIVEAAGPFDRYQKVEAEISAALRTFEPNL